MDIDTSALERARSACDEACNELAGIIEDLEARETEDPDAEKPTVRCVRCGMVAKTATTSAVKWRGAGIDRLCSECAGQLMDWLQNT